MWAQLPDCTGASANLIYYLGTNGTIQNLDPTLAISATNPTTNSISPPSGSIGLALGKNLNAATPAITFYASVSSGGGYAYYYYNGSTWVNTGYNSGNSTACNPGSGGNYVFNMTDANGDVYRYDGTANGSFLSSNTGWDGPHDIQGDCAGNYYILSCNSNQWLHEFNSAGTLINSWTLSGMPAVSSGGGMAIINNTVYAYNNSLRAGAISGSNVSFSTAIGSLNPSPYDFSSCPIGGITSGVSDTSFYCGTGTGVTLTVSGVGPFTWSVVNGPAVISGSGSTVTVTSTASSIITVIDSSGCGGGTVADSTFLIVPTATVKAGTATDLVGCGIFNDVLHGSLANTTSWLTYSISWTPAGSIVFGATTLNPSINPTASTTYYITVSTPANQGGCNWTDSVLVSVTDTSVHANFFYNIKYGCHGDTVIFTNNTIRAAHYRWDFSDGTIDTAINPTHIFVNQGNYSVKLYASNPICNDSSVQAINLVHPLHAAFTTDKDTLCQDGTVNFTNTSVTTVQNGINPSYLWSYADGQTDNTLNTVHTFNLPGVYKVMLAVADFVPCFDTVYHIIVVDSLPFINFSMSDSVFCQGKGITFTGDYLHMGNTELIWNFGDGENTTITDRNPISHAYDIPGTFIITFSSNYAFCPDTSIAKIIKVNAYPTINLGPDTVMCPNAAAISIKDLINFGNGAASWLWNTGETSPAILVKEPGEYWSTVTIGGCTATDSVTVNKDCYIDIPNIFTPNGDGINDYFLPRQLLSSGLAAFSMKIFDRWGVLLFETTNIDGRGWDGKYNNVPQPQGVYVYLIEATFKNGVNENFKGSITLVR